MKKRNPAAVFFLPFITFGIYSLVWEVKTKNEMNRLGAQIPTAWLLIVPFVNLYWLYKYCEGVEKVTGGKVSTLLAFVLLALLSVVGMAIVQNEFNKVAGDQAAPAVPPVPVPTGQPLPDNSFGGPVAPTPPTPPTPPVPPAVPPQAPPAPPQPVVTPPAPGTPFPPTDPTQPAPPQSPQAP